jgi:hypothetical protein
MNEILWHLPVPATGLIQGPNFKALPKQQCEISFSVEGQDGKERWISLLFENVEAFKCTYLASLSSVDKDLRMDAYGTLINTKSSNWLENVSKSCSKYCQTAQMPLKVLQHLAICFDDGPYYEFICQSFRVL